jgi:hypothetical protein
MITVEGDSDSSIQVVGLTRISAFGRIHQNIDEKHGRLLKKSLVRYSLTGLYAPRVSRLVRKTCNLAVNPDRHRNQKSLLFSILAGWWAFAIFIIPSRFFAFYRGIRSAKRHKTVVTIT